MKASASNPEKLLTIEFEDNSLLPLLFGSHSVHLAQIEQELDVSLNSRGNQVDISGTRETTEQTNLILNKLYSRLEKGQTVNSVEVGMAIRMAVEGEFAGPQDIGTDVHVIRTTKRQIKPHTLQQANYIDAINSSDLTFGLGPAGTGKTYLAVAKAVECLSRGQVDRIILSRPAVEAGEQIGFLPGDMREKVDPYMRPIYDALQDMLPNNVVEKKIENQEIEIAPLAFMRGRTLSNAFVILDEAQNTTPIQMKMSLTRMGNNSQMIVTGDLSQIDLPEGASSGLLDAVNRLKGVKGIRFVEFSEVDVVRHHLVRRIIDAYSR